MKIEIDEGSGFCHGVVSAIRKAEEALTQNCALYCLGDIVHNNDEVKRLEDKGMVTITHDDLPRLGGARVLLRAHGEPPATYEIARRNGIEIIDATCPVVLRLQQRIKDSYINSGKGTQIVIYGKVGHAEVNGLVGQTDGNAIVIQNLDDLDKIDFNRNIDLYSQTTMSVSGFKEIIAEIECRKSASAIFRSFDTICRQVANRVDALKRFASEHDVVLFVCGAKSSNGKFLYEECRSVNPRTHLVSSLEIDPEWFEGAESIGICGATSTPRWLMERLRDSLRACLESNSFNF